MEDMRCYSSGNKVTIEEEYYKKLLKYKDSYNALCSAIASYYELDSNGNVIGVDAYELADHLEVIVTGKKNRR